MSFNYDDVAPVQTCAGLVHGYAQDEVYIFKGVPYAYADRFQMPAEPEPWEGIREASSYGFVCPLLTQDTPTGELMVPHRYWPMDEHCQNLNIWTKTLDTEAKKPVVVWLHGGGYSAGSAIEQTAYDGHAMCTNGDVVVVTVNHRLNILGYLDLSPFGEKYKNSANAGHADLVAALKWIQKNIEAFGGDSANVTIFGQSGGGMKVTGLMQIPEADGLFHRGIVMSGVDDGKLLPSMPGDGTEIVNALLQELGLSENQVEELETVDYHDLAKAYGKVSMPLAQKGCYIGNAPMPGDYYKGEPLVNGFTQHALEIPLMVGSVFGEFNFMPAQYHKYSMEQKEKDLLLQKAFGERWHEMVLLFREAYPDKDELDMLELDRVFRPASKELAGLHAKGGKAPAFLYNFALEFPIWNGKPAWHCSDIPFFFHNIDKVEICDMPDGEEVQRVIFGAVMAFVHTGDPNAEELPLWPPVKPNEEPTMVFNRKSAVRYNYDDKLLALQNELLPPFNLMALLAQNVQH